VNFEKRYYFKIEGEEILFYQLLLDENKNPYPGFEGKMYGLENNPVILDITHLGYAPKRGSVWDGETFKLDGIDNKDLDTQHIHLGCTDYTMLAFLVNDIVTGCMAWCGDALGNDAIIAAAKSNPEIIYKLVEVA
jgi:hypothetical protein